jgi:hypothetical protein
VQYIEETFDANKAELSMVIKFGGAGNLPSGNAVSQGSRIIDSLRTSDASQPATIGDVMGVGDSMMSIMEQFQTGLETLTAQVGELQTYADTPEDTSD